MEQNDFEHGKRCFLFYKENLLCKLLEGESLEVPLVEEVNALGFGAEGRLDVVVQDEMKKLLKSLKKEHIIIFSTHILEIAMDLCDEIVILNNKKLELVEKDNLNTKKYKDKIINSLKDSKNV